MKEHHSIFNHALAPITPGPSSSNTCGPVRIGLICNALLGAVPTEVNVAYSKDGAFPTTLYGMKSDVAFINGLLGREQNVSDFNDAYKIAKESEMNVSFSEVDDLTIGGMETVRVTMKDKNGYCLTVIAASIGSGAFKTHYIDDCPINIMGMNYELLVFVEKNTDVNELADKLAGHIEKLNEYCCVEGKDYSIINIKSAAPFSEKLLTDIELIDSVIRWRVLNPIHPIVNDVSKTAPFETPKEMMEYCKENNCSVAQAAVRYEMAISGWTEREVRNYGQMLIDIMKDSRRNGFNSSLKFEGIVSPKASVLQNKMGQGNLPSLGLLNTAVPAALGIMEHSNATGKIVCVPTGGSSGIVPGLLLAAADYMKASEDELYEAVMTAGIIGVLMMVDGNEFSGGTHGCQAEVACGTAMAAAGMVKMIGGTAKQACDAASMSLQCLLGLICDPVAGLVQVPCLARNMAGVSIAATAAECVCSGFDVVIPLDEMTPIMVRVGAEISDNLGICSNGCCLTPTGKRLKEEYDSKRL